MAKKFKRNYTDEEKRIALDYYHECKHMRKTICDLGYPSKSSMHEWIALEGKPKKAPKKRNRRSNASFNERLNAISRCLFNGDDVYLVAKELQRDVTTIRTWIRLYQKEGISALMDKQKKKLKSNKNAMPNEINVLKTKLMDLQLENDILRETIDILKKDPGINKMALKNSEKAVIVDALRGKYSLPVLLNKLNLSRSSYYYQEKVMRQPDKYESLREKIRKIFYDNKSRYGSRRIWGVLTKGNEPIVVSEKVVRRIMKEEGLVVNYQKKKKYSSYQGEITPAVPNLVNRNFHANKPNQLWLTDITEFYIPAGRIYLSPIVDCFDGMVVAWTIGTNPNAELVNKMLEQGLLSLKNGEHPIIHSDRGAHYRWPGWIERMQKASLVRSMSKKGCSPDNSACEGFFGRLKNEMFYGRDWRNTSIDEFINELNNYIIWYNEERVKESLNYLSPMKYRHFLGLAA
ncbi:MAG: IS3 family transposase [Alphaproteobacteria bacterium]|nr:IS3 family transposase [Alphaproteobacteria bacterium]